MTIVQLADAAISGCHDKKGEAPCRVCLIGVIARAVAEERARGEADVKAAKAESFIAGKMDERARCAKIARSRRGGLISGEAALEIAAEIEKG